MNIKQEVGKVQDELIKYELMTPCKSNKPWPVSLSVENMMNESNKITKHIVAKWDDLYGVAEKVEELNKFFSGELFVLGITQKAAWIKADHEDKVEYLKENQFGHPALFPVWLESKKVA